ncbi:MAG: substrate-binding domain-containing protein [Cellulosilyticaceae bacterium]
MSDFEPLYIRIRKYLLEVIEKNKETPDFKLPSENQLALKFGASRITAKNAILSLEKDGFVYRRQGKGTFITAKANQLDRLEEEKQSPTICLIVPGVQGQFIAKIAEGVQAFLQENKLKLSIMVTACNQKLEEEMIQTAIQNNCKGLIIFPVDHNIYNKEIVKLSLRNFPVVLVDRYLAGMDISYVACDHYTAAYNGTKYLIERGHRHIGFIGLEPDAASSVQERRNGYQRAMLDLTGEFDKSLQLSCEHNIAEFETVVIRYLDAHPQLSALITTSTGYGPQLVKLLHQKKIRIPEDLTLMLFDNEFEEYLELLSFKPIIIDQNPYSIGHKAAEILYRLLYRNPKPKKVLLAERIIEHTKH